MTYSTELVKKYLDRNKKVLDGLTPTTRYKFENMVNDLLYNEGILLLIYRGQATFDEQNELYDKYLKGGVKSAPAGYSYHNYGRGGDVVPILSNGKAEWNEDSPLWDVVGTAGVRNGLSWGESFGDTNHFSNKDISLTALRNASNYSTWLAGMDQGTIITTAGTKLPTFKKKMKIGFISEARFSLFWFFYRMLEKTLYPKKLDNGIPTG